MDRGRAQTQRAKQQNQPPLCQAKAISNIKQFLSEFEKYLWLKKHPPNVIAPTKPINTSHPKRTISYLSSMA